MIKPFSSDYPLTQAFGVNPDMYSRFIVKQPDGTTAPMRGHNGLDFKVPTGTTIIAPFDGKIIESYFDKDGYGNYIKIESDTEGIVMAHLEKVLVEIGATVKQGEPVGVSDNTGYSTAPHLHIGYYRIPRDRSNGYGGFIDPSPYIDGFMTNPVSGPLHTDNEYKACMADREKFWKERDAALIENKRLTDELSAVKSLYSAFEALGYKTVDDVNAMKKENDTVIEGLNFQLVQVQKRNSELADLLKKKEEEDYTAIEEGIKAKKKSDTLESTVEQIKNAIGLKGSVSNFELIDKVLSFSAYARSFLARKEENKNSTQNTLSKQSTSINSLLIFLGLAVLTIAIGASVWFTYR